MEKILLTGKMEEATKQKLRVIRLVFIKIMARYDRGWGLFNRPIAFIKTGTIVALGFDFLNNHKVLGFVISLNYLWWGMVGLAILSFIVGFIDQRYLRITQAEQEYSSRHLNNFWRKLEKDIEEIKKNGNSDNQN